DIGSAPRAGAPAAQAARGGGSGPRGSPAGHFVYFMRGADLWRVAVDTGAESRMIQSVSDGSRVAVTRRGVYFVPGATFTPAAVEQTIDFFDFDTGRITRFARLEKPMFIGMAVSPDERWLLFAQIDQTGSDLMLADDFR